MQSAIANFYYLLSIIISIYISFVMIASPPSPEKSGSRVLGDTRGIAMTFFVPGKKLLQAGQGSL